MTEWGKLRDYSEARSIAVVASDDDAAVIAEVVADQEVTLLRLGVADFIAGIQSNELGIALVAEESLTPHDLQAIKKALSDQQPWSNFPIILLADRAALAESPSVNGLDTLRIVERPLHPVSLRAAVRSAFRSRSLQRQAWQYAQDRMEAEAALRRSEKLLSAKVARRLADLKALSERLAEEVEERKHAEERLRESEELYRYTVELSQQMVWTADPQGRVIWSSPGFRRTTGLKQRRPERGWLSQVIHPDDVGNVRAAWNEALERGKGHAIEYRMRIADGSYRMFATRAAPRRDDSGRIIRWYGLTEDVHEKKLAAIALSQAEERYRLAARATNDAIWDWNLVTDLVDWSEAVSIYRGDQPGQDSTIQWWEDNIHPDDRKRVVNSLSATLESDVSRWSAAYRFRKAEGGYAFVYDRGFIIRNEEGEAIRAVGAVVDLTERRRAEAELRRTQAELIHVSRLSAMGTMASTLAHELNQPLTAVTSYVRGSRRLLSHIDDPNAQQVCEALEHAEAGALRAGQIVRRLRELVARGNVAVGAEDLDKLIQDASVLAFVDEHLHSISHRVLIDPSARWVQVDRIQIQQVLINLIRNAVQAMQHSQEREVVIATVGSSTDLVEVSVSDTGSGIPDQVRDALFSPFRSTKSGGLGIGLSISRTIVEAHHGKIWAEDRPGGGTVFRFTLPRADVPVHDPSGMIDADEAND
ncbi:MAG: domain S-box protein [Alphaproteobacteria bacterium]|nr:domain S-box protein [Alphaproteobacteria bacterium]